MNRSPEARARRRAAAEARKARHCPTGKRRFDTEHDAQVALVDAVIGRNRGKGQRHEVRFYICPRCTGWHLTSAPLRRTAA